MLSPSHFLLKKPYPYEFSCKTQKFLNDKIEQINVNVDLFENFLEESYRSICMPLPTHSFISQAILAREVNKNGAKILFTGDGGDELFGGYEFYKTLEYDKEYKYNPSVYSGIFNQGVTFNNFDINFTDFVELK